MRVTKRWLVSNVTFLWKRRKFLVQVPLENIYDYVMCQQHMAFSAFMKQNDTKRYNGQHG